ncbi:hypothetical protein [uncultured Clostridium sp.]|uniref:hypothetical protein n=1 Tax=uncultured Clostridium sp. TaxID=59620 RepID=UPI0025D2927F|nr:hypothetical protein [uncultured Clostridium sp.]
MKLTNLNLLYIPGDRIYRQGVKGKNNYQHQSGRNRYNGYGGQDEFTAAQLILAGIDKEGQVREFDIKRCVLDVSGRKKLGNKFVNKLKSNLPDEVKIKDGRFPDDFWDELVG